MAQWFSIQEVARRLNTTSRTVRRRCQSGDLPGAEKTDGVWRIPVTADARLSAGPGVAAADAASLQKVPKPKMDEAVRRAGVIKQFEKFAREHQRTGGTRSEAIEIFAYQNNVATGTLRRWVSSFKSEGVFGLVDQRGGARGGETISPDAWELFKALFLDPRQPSIKQCLRMVAHHSESEGLGWKVPLYASLCRYIDKHLPLPVRVLHREGQAAYDAKCAPYIQSDLSGVEPGSVWVGDHHQFNVLIQHRGKWVRPWLTAWMDLRSRAQVGWRVCLQPNQTTILAAFRDAAKKCGPPDAVKIDNGRDYDSETFTGMTKKRRKVLKAGYLDEATVSGLYGLLGIEASFAIPYHPQSKSIERLFDTVDQQFCKFIPTYCGKDAKRKPESLNDYLKTQKAINEAHTLDSFSKVFADYASVYNKRPHSSLNGQTPLEVFETRESKRVALDGVLDLLCRVWRQAKVTKNGIRVGGLNYGQYNPRVLALQGRTVHVSYDPSDVGVIFIYDDSFKFVTRAECNRLVAFGRQAVSDGAVREAMRQKARALKALKRQRDASRVRAMDVAVLALESQAAETRPTPPPAAAKIKPVKTVLDDQLDVHVAPARPAPPAIHLDWDDDPPAPPALHLDWDDLDEEFYNAG